MYNPAHEIKTAKSAISETMQENLERNKQRDANDLNTTSPLTAREVCQVLTDVAFGKRIMIRSTIQSWNEIYHRLMSVEIEG